MAVREVYSLIQSNEVIGGTTQLHAGAAVARNPSDGTLKAADRSSDTRGNYLGVLADDTSRSGNTMALVDPVGATYIDGSGNFQDFTNGYYVATKRAILDYQDETVRNVANLVDATSGFASPRRGAAVYSSSSTILCTDQWASYKTNDSGGSAPYTVADAAFSGGDAYLTNSLLSYGAGANAGLFVLNTDTVRSLIVARFDKWADAGQKLMQITLLV
jgi:hypothetical protein